MKVSKAKASANRDAIVDAAAAQIRAQGYDQMSVAEVARAAGLTHGALYSNFGSKEALKAAATERSFEATIQAFTGLSFDAFLDRYLSDGHRDHPEVGCPNAALVSEVWRQPEEARRAFQKGFERFVDLAGESLANAGAAHGRERTITVFAAMVGGLALARALRESDAAASEAVLRAVAGELRSWATPEAAAS